MSDQNVQPIFRVTPDQTIHEARGLVEGATVRHAWEIGQPGFAESPCATASRAQKYVWFIYRDVAAHALREYLEQSIKNLETDIARLTAKLEALK